MMRAHHSLLITVALLAACEAPVGESNPGPLFARGGTDPSVASTNPSYGNQGNQGLSVHVLGSGFDSGSIASWERNGAADPKIHVDSTSFVSSSELIAFIDIDANADVALYNVAVTTSSGRKGIGTELFVVSSITILPHIGGGVHPGSALGINDAGQIVGRDESNAFFWSASTGFQDLGVGQARDLSATGTTIVGSTSITTDGMPRIWTGGAGNWTGAPLSVSCVSGTVTGGVARAVTSDGSAAGGVIRIQGSRKNSTLTRPVLWNLGSGVCSVLPLPGGFTEAMVTDVNGLGMATGSGVVWNADATFTVLAPLPGETTAGTEAISEDGNVAVGYSGLRAAYWVRSGGLWSAAIALPTAASCQAGGAWANDVNNGIIVGKGCDGGAWYWTISAGVLTSTNRLLGTGPKSSGAAEAVNGVTAAGQPWIAGVSNNESAYWIRP